jgi:hypothetical protein
MSRGRVVAIGVALVVMIGVFAECSSGNSNSSTAAADRRAAAAINADAARNRAITARRQAAARARQQQQQTSTTTPRTVETQAATTVGQDLASIQHTVDSLNAAFRTSVASGITSSLTANHWIDAGAYSRDTCTAFETARGQGIVAEELVIQPTSLTPAPGWVDPTIGQVPAGRIYQVQIQEIQTLVTTGQQRSRDFTIHVTVRPDGRARLLLRCS